MAVTRTSATLEPENAEQLKQYQNRSKVINDALRLYFTMERYAAEEEVKLSSAEEELIMREWEHYKKTGECYTEEEVFGREL